MRVRKDNMEHRKVEGAERADLLSRKKQPGFNYAKYLQVLNDYADGDVAAVKVADVSAQRGEKIRFSRAARLVDKSLIWLANPNDGEIAFQVAPLREKRPRAKRTS